MDLLYNPDRLVLNLTFADWRTFNVNNGQFGKTRHQFDIGQLANYDVNMGKFGFILSPLVER